MGSGRGQGKEGVLESPGSPKDAENWALQGKGEEGKGVTGAEGRRGSRLKSTQDI